MFTKTVIFVVISFLLAAALIDSLSGTYYVLALPPDPNFEKGDCINSLETLSVSCCWTEAHKSSQFNWVEWNVCQVCDIDVDTGDFIDCNEPEVTNTAMPPSPR